MSSLLITIHLLCLILWSLESRGMNELKYEGRLQKRDKHIEGHHLHDFRDTCWIPNPLDSIIQDITRGVLPPKLYLVLFYQVSLVNWTGLTFSDFKRPLEVLLGSSCCTISHVHTPRGSCNKCSSMILYVEDSVS